MRHTAPPTTSSCVPDPLIAATGACPPEDCGSAWGYASLKEISPTPSTMNTK
jgi:hypothetical protein